jgi:hypothetical protein
VTRHGRDPGCWFTSRAQACTLNWFCFGAQRVHYGADVADIPGRMVD